MSSSSSSIVEWGCVTLTLTDDDDVAPVSTQLSPSRTPAT